jgi:hypothetical protein
MTSQKKNDLIMKCLSTRQRHVSIDRAYELAKMAIEGRCPGELFDEYEREVWYEYWWFVKPYLLKERGSA